MPRSHAPAAKVRIRDMSVDDIAQVYHLGEALFTARRFPILHRTWDPYEVAYLFVSESDLNLVAARGETVVGFCLSTTTEKPDDDRPYGYLIWLGVSSKVQKQGVGKRLVREMLRRMKEQGVKEVLLDTEDAEGGAAGFFRRIGFEGIRRQVWMKGRT
jgi:ribosomal protein S18 acetylase RimI-like enzyme